MCLYYLFWTSLVSSTAGWAVGEIASSLCLKPILVIGISFDDKLKSDFYFKDKNYVYFGGKVLPDSDVRTFIVHDELQVKKGIYYKAEDKNNYYEYGKAVLEK